MLRLRPYKTNDYKYMSNWLKNRREFCMWCADLFKYPLNKEVLADYEKKYDEDESGIIFIAVNEKGTPVGHFLLKDIDYVKESAYVAFVVIDPEFRGKGYGTEMMNQAVKYGFEVLNVSRLTLGVYDNNSNAYACYKKAGFIDENHLDKIFNFEGEDWGLYEMAIEKQQ